MKYILKLISKEGLNNLYILRLIFKIIIKLKNILLKIN